MLQHEQPDFPDTMVKQVAYWAIKASSFNLNIACRKSEYLILIISWTAVSQSVLTSFCFSWFALACGQSKVVSPPCLSTQCTLFDITGRCYDSLQKKAFKLQMISLWSEGLVTDGTDAAVPRLSTLPDGVRNLGRVR